MAAVTQIRIGAEGSVYYAKLIAAGKTRTEALRLLRRRISDRVFIAMRADETRLDAGRAAAPECGPRDDHHALTALPAAA